MAKSITCELNGEKIALCWNLFAEITISEAYGSTDAAYDAISEGSEAEILKGLCNWLHALAQGAIQERIALGREHEDIATWLNSPSTIMAVLSPFDLPQLGESIRNAINAGQETKVKASAKKKTE